MTVAAVVSAAKPWIGSSSTTRWPIVCMIRQPPIAVPSESAVAETRSPKRDRSTLGITPAENRARVMMPIVFWASLEPWANAMNPAENTCAAEAGGERLAPDVPEDPGADHQDRAR